MRVNLLFARRACCLLTLFPMVVAFRPREERRVIPKRPPPKVVHSSSVSVEDVMKDTSTQFPIPQESDITSLSVPRPSVPLVQLALAGSATTFFADACIHPVDCIKTLQQSDFGAELGFLEASSYLFETSGIQGFFNGLLTYACSDAVGGAIKFSVWETWKKKFEDPRLVWVGAALAFVAASVVIAPGEFLKQQLQMSHFDSLGQAAQSIYLNQGLGGFFLGYDAVVLRDVPHTILELCLYDLFKRAGSLFQQDQGQPPREMNPIMAACATGCVAGFLTTPMDTIKTKVMVEDSYDSIWDCLATTLDTHGWDGMWAGALARVLWIAPFTMLYLPTYDFLHNTLLERHLHVSDLKEPPSFLDIDDDN